jgi:small GTP-binding protein
MLKYKIVLAGSKDVGKSSLITRFCDNVFLEETISTIGVGFKRKKVDINDKLGLELHIWDFGGEEKYRTLLPSYCNGASAALILYDITNKESLNDVKNWVKIIDKNAVENVVKIMIGTKIDLENQRAIPFAEAQKMSQKFNCLGAPIETSSKTGENVENAFVNVSKAIVKQNLQYCKNCGEFFVKNLKFCNYCGAKADLKPILF